MQNKRQTERNSFTFISSCQFDGQKVVKMTHFSFQKSKNFYLESHRHFSLRIFTGQKANR